jgi:DNA-binding beta-propeller fold protein YncE
MRAKMFGLLIVFSVIGLVSAWPSIAAASTKMYFTDSNNSGQAVAKVWQSNLDGSNLKPLVPPDLNPRYIALDLSEGKMYWTDIGSIRRANLDGSNVENGFIIGLLGPMGIAIDAVASKIYWTDSSTNMIQRANLDGTGIENLITGLGDPRALALDTIAGKIYWTDTLTDKVQRANLDGSNPEDLVTGQSFAQGIALDGQDGRMYWLNNWWVWSAKFDGTDAQQVFYCEPSIGIALDTLGRKVYWTNINRQSVQRANLDGSAIEDLVISGLDTPWGIALAFYPAVEVSVDLKPGSDENTVNLSSAGVVPVAILSSPDFDAMTVKEDTIDLSGATVRLAGKSNKYMCKEADVNDDGLIDLVCKIDTAELLLTPGDTIVEMTAETADGSYIRGTDYVRIVH